MIHPDWLHKKVCEKEDRFRQRKLIDIFNAARKDEMAHDKIFGVDIEEILTKEDERAVPPQPVVHSYESNKKYSSQSSSLGVKFSNIEKQDLFIENCSSDIVNKATNYQAWLEIKKRKWRATREEKKRRR